MHQLVRREAKAQNDQWVLVEEKQNLLPYSRLNIFWQNSLLLENANSMEWKCSAGTCQFHWNFPQLPGLPSSLAAPLVICWVARSMDGLLLGIPETVDFWAAWHPGQLMWQSGNLYNLWILVDIMVLLWNVTMKNCCIMNASMYIDSSSQTGHAPDWGQRGGI